MTPAQFVLVALIPFAMAYFAFCFHQSDRVEIEGEGWLRSFNAHQESQQATLFTQLLYSLLPELVESFFGPGPIEASPLTATAVNNAAAELARDPGQTDLLVRRNLTEPIVRAVLPNMLERLASLAPTMVLLQPVREAVEKLRCYASDDDSARRRARSIANGYAVQMAAILIWVALDGLLIALGGYGLTEAVVGGALVVLGHAMVLEVRRRRLRYALGPILPEGKQ